jgi:SSS family solute:Na+ symporter
MSMLASDLNCLAVIVVEDFYGRYVPRSSDARRLRVGKITVAVCGVLAIAGALRLSTTQGSALSLYYLLTAIVAGGLAGLFLLAFLVPRAGRAAAIIAVLANLVFTAWATLTMNGGHTWNLHRWNYPWHELTIGAVGNILMFFVGCIASVVLPADSVAGPTLWDWLEMGRQSKREKALGGTHESIAQSS